MSETRELSFCELRAKEVVNVLDGRRLGRICDIVFCAHRGHVRGIVVPFARRFFFSRSQDVFIPWKCINRIGEDVILVTLVGSCHHEKGKHRFEECDPFVSPRHEEKREEKDCRRHHKDCRCEICLELIRCMCRGKDCGCERCGGKHKEREREGDCREKEKDKDKDRPPCDRKCEKCMLFDCAHRWKN